MRVFFFYFTRNQSLGLYVYSFEEPHYARTEFNCNLIRARADLNQMLCRTFHSPPMRIK